MLKGLRMLKVACWFFAKLSLCILFDVVFWLRGSGVSLRGMVSCRQDV
jgi:hypothetical protein